MSSERAGLFEENDGGGAGDFDVSIFAPKKSVAPAPPTEAVRSVSESANFVSREPAPVAVKQRDRRHRTGRNEQLNIKVTAQCLRLFYDLTDNNNWVQGETLERALAALQRELGGAK